MPQGSAAELPEAAAFVWAAVEGDEDDWSERLARDHGIPALPGRHFHAAHAAPADPVRRAAGGTRGAAPGVQRSTPAGRAPVTAPSRTTASPATQTPTTPSGLRIGSSYVAVST